MKSKFIAVLLCIILSVQGIFTCIYAADAETKSELNEAEKLMLDLGVIKGSTSAFNGEKLMTRAEFAESIAKLCDFDLSNKQAYFYIKDVASSHAQSAAIWQTVMNGFLSLDEQGMFYPDKNVTLGDAVNAVLRVLGRGYLIALEGGYQNDEYLTRVYRGVQNSFDKEATCGEIAAIFYNACQLDMFQEVGFGDQTIVERQKDVTILSRYQDIYKASGIVTANSLTGITGGSTLSEGYVVIAEEVYEEGVTNASELLGQYVDAYYRMRKDEDEKTLVSVSSNNQKNNVVRVSSENIAEKTTNKRFYYYDGTRQRNLQIPSNCNVLINYQFVERACNIDAATLQPEAGSVVLIDNNGDEQPDLILIHSYTLGVVQLVDKNAERIIFKFGVAPVNFGGTVKYQINRGGKRVSSQNIKDEITSSSVVELYRQPQGEGFVMNVLSNKISAQISAVHETTLNGKRFTEKITLDGKEYNVSPQFTDDDGHSAFSGANESGQQNISPLTVGTSALFTLDTFGQIVYMEVLEDAAMEYGYVTDFGKASVLGGGECMLKILNQNGEVKIYNVKEKIKLDGYSGKKDADIETALKAVADTPGKVNSMVKFMLNEEGKITKLDTLVENQNPDDPEGLRKSVLSGRRRYIYGNMLASGMARTIVANNYKAFLVPTNPSSDKDYQASNSYLKTQEYYTDVEAYDVDNNKTKVLKFTLDNSSGAGGLGKISTSNDPLHVVKKIINTSDAEGNNVKKIITMSNGRESVINMDSETRIVADKAGQTLLAPKDLQIGDLLMADQDLQGYADVIYRVNTQPMAKMTYAAAEVQSYCETTFGYVRSFEDSVLEVQVAKDQGTIIYNLEKSKPKIYICDMKERNVQIGSVNDLLASENEKYASKVFVRTRFGDVKEIIIYMFN